MRLLTLVDYYLPGYKAGGPIRTMANMVAHLGKEIDFWIITRDRDLASNAPFKDIIVDQWNDLGAVQIFYASPPMLTFRGIQRLLRVTPHDAIYLNSFFSPHTTGIPLLLRRLGEFTDKPIIIAPRGEFSAGALALKRRKKTLYLALTTRMGLYRNLIWQASSEYEAADIRAVLGSLAGEIHIAPDLLSPRTISGSADEELPVIPMRRPGPLRLVFLSRISPKKNLDFLLRVLAQVRGAVELTIAGPLEAPDHWEVCRTLIAALPDAVRVTYAGAVKPAAVAEKFSRHDLFVFPTRGENFGHVIYEALAAGTPVMVSDQTPWQMDTEGAVTVLPLSNSQDWVKVIETWLTFDADTLTKKRWAAWRYAARYLETSEALEQNRALFRAAFS